jgi:hypothetical protein
VLYHSSQAQFPSARPEQNLTLTFAEQAPAAGASGRQAWPTLTKSAGEGKELAVDAVQASPRLPQIMQPVNQAPVLCCGERERDSHVLYSGTVQYSTVTGLSARMYMLPVLYSSHAGADSASAAKHDTPLL